MASYFWIVHRSFLFYIFIEWHFLCKPVFLPGFLPNQKGNLFKQCGIKD